MLVSVVWGDVIFGGEVFDEALLLCWLRHATEGHSGNIVALRFQH